MTATCPLTRRRHSLIGSALLGSALAFPGLATADITLTQSVRVDAGGALAAMNSTGTVKTMIAGERGRTENRMEASSGLMKRFASNMNTATIVRLDQQKMLHLMPEEQQYSEMSFAEMRAQMEQSMAQMEQMQAGGALPVSDEQCRWSEPTLNVDKTGERARFAGVKASQTKITASQTCTVPETGKQCDMTWTLDYWMAKRMPGDDEAMAFQEGMAKAMGGDDALALAQVQARGLMAMFKKGWDDVLAESEDLKGYPVKTVMSLEIGGEQCTTSAGQPIALDDMWTRAGDAAFDAAASTAAGHAGAAIGREAADAMGDSIGGSIAGSAVGAAGREIVSGVFSSFGKKRKEKRAAEQAAAAQAANPAAGKVALFTIATELTAVDDGAVPSSNFEVPAGWAQVKDPRF